VTGGGLRVGEKFVVGLRELKGFLLTEYQRVFGHWVDPGSGRRQGVEGIHVHDRAGGDGVRLRLAGRFGSAPAAERLARRIGSEPRRTKRGMIDLGWSTLRRPGVRVLTGYAERQAASGRDEIPGATLVGRPGGGCT